MAYVEQKKNRDGGAEVRAEPTATKVGGEEGTIMVKHSEQLREEDDGGGIFQIWWW